MKKIEVLDLGFLVDEMSGISFSFLFMTSSWIQSSRFNGSKIYWILGYTVTRVFRALVRLFSISGSKVMPKKFQIFQEFP